MTRRFITNLDLDLHENATEALQIRRLTGKAECHDDGSKGTRSLRQEFPCSDDIAECNHSRPFLQSRHSHLGSSPYPLR